MRPSESLTRVFLAFILAASISSAQVPFTMHYSHAGESRDYRFDGKTIFIDYGGDSDYVGEIEVQAADFDLSTLKISDLPLTESKTFSLRCKGGRQCVSTDGLRPAHPNLFGSGDHQASDLTVYCNT